MNEISPIFWVLFNVFVVLMLALDLLVFHKKHHEIKIKEALGWSAFWIALALAFNVMIYYWQGKDQALEFLTAYLVEKSLSVDNLFVFIMIFSYFRVDPAYQHGVLFWGVLGALVMRAIFIFAGIVLIQQFHFLVYGLGAFLIYGGIKMLLHKGDEEINPEKNFLVNGFRKLFPVLPNFHEDKFFVRIDGKLFATPMIIVLLIVETTDVVFALDSIPAILAISEHPFIIYTSNIFAILGLRALYFALAGVMQLFHFLKYGLSIILVFIGVKIMIADFYKIDIGVALGTVAAILSISVVASLIFHQQPTEPVTPNNEPKGNKAEELVK